MVHQNTLDRITLLSIVSVFTGETYVIYKKIRISEEWLDYKPYTAVQHLQTDMILIFQQKKSLM